MSATASAALPSVNQDCDAARLAEDLRTVVERSQRIATDFLQEQIRSSTSDPLDLGSAYMQLWSRLLMDPSRIAEHQLAFWQDFLSLKHYSVKRSFGGNVEPVVAPGGGDRRFRADDWQDNPAFDHIKQFYLLASRCIMASVSGVEGLDDKTAQKIEFFTQQFVDALSPTNFALTNPTVLRETLDSRGENLFNGLKNLLEDIERGKGKLATRMTDTKAFELGNNIASTPGSVVFQTDMMQLIQYAPSTEEVNARPVLIVPPWINKYYILDLQPKNSLIKYLVDQGHTVFVMSWINPDESYADKNFEDYLSDGVLAACDAVEAITGEHQVNAIGYCLGGTLLATATAWCEAAGDQRFASGTYFTTMLDFAEPGEIGVFIDEGQLDNLEKSMAESGYLDGGNMAGAFNMLRANDLVWPFFINNYLLGKEPMSFDLLYWNSDSTRMPAAMHNFYLRNMYQYNRLSKKGGIELLGQKIDLSSIQTPSYFLSTSEDHIAPWQSTFTGAKLFKGPVRFVLGGSGHIAGVVNPPAANKYGYRTGRKPAGNPQTWLKSAKENEGSWWPDWDSWVEKFAAGKVPARQPGAVDAYPVIEAAPGSYAKKRLIPA